MRRNYIISKAKRKAYKYTFQLKDMRPGEDFHLPGDKLLSRIQPTYHDFMGEKTYRRIPPSDDRFLFIEAGYMTPGRSVRKVSCEIEVIPVNYQAVKNRCLRRLYRARKASNAHEQYVLFEFHNVSPFVQRFLSALPITLDRVAEFAKTRMDFNEERDNLTLIDSPIDENI